MQTVCIFGGLLVYGGNCKGTHNEECSGDLRSWFNLGFIQWRGGGHIKWTTIINFPSFPRALKFPRFGGCPFPTCGETSYHFFTRFYMSVSLSRAGKHCTYLNLQHKKNACTSSLAFQNNNRVTLHCPDTKVGGKGRRSVVCSFIRIDMVRIW